MVLAEGGIVLSKKLAYQKNSRYDTKTSTKNALVYLEALPPVTEERMEKILRELGDLIRASCGGKTKIYFLDSRKMEIKF